MYDYAKQHRNNKILHYTLGRSGSAFISQILFTVFGRNNVWAGHEAVGFPVKHPQKLIITIRDFRDMAVSHWRVNHSGRKGVSFASLDSGFKIPDHEVKTLFNHTAQSISSLNKVYQLNPDALIMRYEDFFPDKFDYIFPRIEKHCGIVIPEPKKKAIMEKYNFAKNKERSMKLDSFAKVGEEYMHGKHVYKGKIGGWKDLVPAHMHGFVNNTLSTQLQKWGYKI